jgi:transposase
MLTVDEYIRIRIAHRDGMSVRQIARRGSVKDYSHIFS